MGEARDMTREDAQAFVQQVMDGTAELTEDGVALKFRERHGDGLRYCHDMGRWFVWDGSIWQPNRTGLAFTWARVLVRELNRSAEFKSRAITAKASFAASVEKYARSDEPFAVTADAWDTDDFLLGTPGGTVDLRTGRMRAALPSDLISKSTACAPAPPGARCDRWIAFLDQATGRDADLIRFLQIWFGYCLTGSTREQALMFVHGFGGNGKGVMLHTVEGILGTYAASAAMDAFTAGGSERHSTDLAMLAGARLVTATETEEGRAWAEARIKALTGGDRITARWMHQNNFTFVPRLKLLISGNHKPTLRNVDDAARRRFNIVPFIHKPAQRDPDLEEKLKLEWPAILRWMVEGCLAWQADGLHRPRIVAAATDEYFAAHDTIGRWIAERCILSPDLAEKPGRLLSDCRAWAAENGETQPTPTQFKTAMEKQEGLRYATVRGSQLIRGVGLRPSPHHHFPG